MLNPEDIDFPVSDTFAAGLAQMHGWDLPTEHYESLGEARNREAHEAYLNSRQKPEPSQKGLVRAVERLEAKLEKLEERVYQPKGGKYKYG
ncbi:MAG: hypothetical protein M0R49_01130 [Limnochordia bacterium]|jgi:hypothetical protein|nr:hypothetical protein [Limnochordia bacterium]